MRKTTVDCGKLPQLVRLPSLIKSTTKCVTGLRSSGQSGRDVRLTTHLQVLPCLKMSGALPPLPNAPSWIEQVQYNRTFKLSPDLLSDFAAVTKMCRRTLW